jgi:methionyl-tRNA formyltransferase
MNEKLKIIFFGTPEFIVPIAEFLEQNYQLIGVVTSPDQPVGRHQILTPTPIKEFALDKKIPVFEPEKLDFALAQDLQELEPDLFIVAAYGKIIPQEVLDVPKLGALNIHPSLLPKYRGATPIQAAILNGDSISGVSIIKMDSKMDHGPIACKIEFPISNSDTFESLSHSMFQKSLEILPEAITNLVNGQPFSDQDPSKASFVKIIKKDDGYFDILQPPTSDQLNRMIRAYFPWPNAWTRWNEKSVKFLPQKMVLMEGKKPVHIKDFLNGYPDFPLKEI